MSQRPFVHLHCHTHYSLLDGASRVPELVQLTKSLGMNAISITDHGNLFGAIEFYKECKSAGINPIVGYEAYVAPARRTEREAKRRGEAGFHLTLLAQNAKGFKNLVKMASLAYIEGYHYVPRIDKELLEAHKDGIICLSGCASSEFSEFILREQMDEATELARYFHKLFGKNFYVEIQNNGLDIQKRCAEGAVEIANRLGLPLVATCDAHYLRQEDNLPHDVLLCINTGRTLKDENRMRYGSDQFYVRPPEEMYRLFPGFEEAVKRSQEIADGCDIQLDFKTRHFPVFTPPKGKKPEQYLRELCEQGLQERYGPTAPPDAQARMEEARKRLDHELGVIERMGFASYFLIVWDFVRFAISKQIPASARGSACGATVSYVLRLSHVCPIEYDLLFERFLDPNRSEAPDIDIDFCQDRREDVIQYVREKYGEQSVAQIGTFGTLAAKAAIKDVGRVLDIPLDRVIRLTAMVPTVLNITLDDALEQSPDLRKEYESDPDIRKLIDIARKLEGTNRQAGTHAAGVVIANGPITDYVPVQRVLRKGYDAGNRGSEPVVTTQWVMGDLEKVGMLKMDFLGLRTLTVVDNTFRLILKNRLKTKCDPDKVTPEMIEEIKDSDPRTYNLLKGGLGSIPLDDKQTYGLLQSGFAKGVFQLESDGIRELLKRMKPDNIRDLIATNALYRPGPLGGGMVDAYVNRKHGREKPVYEHAVMEEVLAETYGVLIYQEQVMRVLNRLGGIELASAYACIKAISKKKQEIIDARRAEFIKGSQQRGLDEDTAEKIWDLIVMFAGYGFNKCVVGETVIVHAGTGERTTVGDLFRRRRPFLIHSLGEDGMLRGRRVSDVVWNGRKRVYRLRTTNGNAITATDNHPFRVPAGWSNLGELKRGNRIAGARQLIPGAACGMYWDTVASIEFVGIQDTYDLTVDVDHNFVADGLIVHNSHSAAYALLGYQTAYLKTHYTPEFMAALLSSEIEDSAKRDLMVQHIDDARKLNVEVCAPDVQSCEPDFTVQGGRILFGLCAIKGLGRGAAEEILRARCSGPPFKDLFDFCERIDHKFIPKAAIEKLIKAGAMDRLGGHRAQLLEALPRAVESAGQTQLDKRHGQGNLFEAFGESNGMAAETVDGLREIPRWAPAEQLKYEKEALDFYISSHPLAQFQDTLDRFAPTKVKDLANLPPNQEIFMGGMLTQVRYMNTKKARNGNSRYVRCKLEDFTGAAECVMWPDDYVKYKDLIDEDRIVFVQGMVERNRDEPGLILSRVLTMEQGQKERTTGLVLLLSLRHHQPSQMEAIAQVLKRSRGSVPVFLHVQDAAGKWLKLKASDDYRINPATLPKEDLEVILGPGRVEFARQGYNGNGY